MAKTAVGQWDTTAANNTDINAIGIQGTNLVSNFDNALRELMAQIKTFQTNLYIGHTAQLAVANTDALQVIGTGAASAGVGILAFGVGFQGHLDFYRSRNAAIGSADVVQNGDPLGGINFYGAQQTGTLSNWTRAASIRAEVDGVVTSGAAADMPGRLIFATSPDGSATVADRLTIDSTGKATFTGVVDISGAAAGQIVFPATQNPSAGANTFDDYEEGSFTPVIKGTGVVGAGTYTSQLGSYTKLGNTVTYAMLVTWTAHTGTVNEIIDGLPFTANAAMTFPVTLYLNNHVFAATFFEGYVNAATTQIILNTIATGAGEAALALDGAATIRACGFYYV